MGFFSSSKEQEPVLNRADRSKCWENRDIFFDCLTAHSIDNSLDPEAEQSVKANCGKQREIFTQTCSKSWISYFQQKRFNELKKARYIAQLEAEGAVELPFKIAR